MNLLVLSAVFGFVKGVILTLRSSAPAAQPEWFRQVLMSPLQEEVLYRVVPLYFAPNMPRGWTAVPFALEHVVQESAAGHHQTTVEAFARFTDVFIGGCLYEFAYRRWGFTGALASHSLHNAMNNVGVQVARRARGSDEAQDA